MIGTSNGRPTWKMDGYNACMRRKIAQTASNDYLTRKILLMMKTWPIWHNAHAYNRNRNNYGYKTLGHLHCTALTQCATVGWTVFNDTFNTDTLYCTWVKTGRGQQNAIGFTPTYFVWEQSPCYHVWWYVQLLRYNNAVCDRQTDKWKLGHSICHASIASHGNKTTLLYTSQGTLYFNTIPTTTKWNNQHTTGWPFNSVVYNVYTKQNKQLL